MPRPIKIAGFTLLGLLVAGISAASANASESTFREIDCKEYHALTGYRVCAVQKKVWIKKQRYNELRIERDQKLCRAEAILTYGRDVCLSTPTNSVQKQDHNHCVAALSECQVRHNLSAIDNNRSAEMARNGMPSRR